MRIVLYRDGQGQTIPQDFLSELDPPPQGFEVIDMAQAQLERAKWLINAYCMEVFEQEADFSDLSHAPGVQLHSDSAHTVEISADLVSFRLSIWWTVRRQRPSMRRFRDLNEFLANLDFDEMVAFAEEEYNKQCQGQEHPADTAPRQAEQTGAEPDVRFYAVELDRGSQIAYGVGVTRTTVSMWDDEGVSENLPAGGRRRNTPAS